MDTILQKIEKINKEIHNINLKLPKKNGGLVEGKKLVQKKAIEENKKVKANLKIELRKLEDELILSKRLINEINNTFDKFNDPTPENLEKNHIEELKEILKREIVSATPTEVKFSNKHNVNKSKAVKKVSNVYSNLNIVDIDSDGGFKYMEGSEKVKNSFIDKIYDNPENILSVNLFIGIRHYIKQIKPIASAISVRFFMGYTDERDIAINSEYNLSKSLIERLLKAKTADEVNDINLSISGEDAQGSDSQVDSITFNPRMFQIGYRPIDVKGGALINPPVVNSHNHHIEECEGFICVSPPNTGNNCLIECFRFYADKNKKAELSRSIRLKLNFKIDVMLSLKDIPKLENYYGKKVCVITGRNLETGNLNILHGDPVTCDFGIMYNNEHFSAIRADAQELKRQEEEKRNAAKEKKRSLIDYWANFKIRFPEVYAQKQEEWKQTQKDKKNAPPKPYRYMFFDYETVYNKKGKLYPYALSAIVFNDKWERVDEYFESDQIGERQTKINESFAKFLRKHDNPEFRNLMVSYNGSRFDNFLLGEMLGKMNLLKGNNIQMANGQMLRMRFLSYTVIDLCKFVMLPLKVACEGFKCSDNKLDFDHNEVQKAQNENKLGQWLKDNNVKLKEYNDRDNIVLMQLFKKVKESIYHLTKQELEKFMTISQMTYEHWREKWGYDVVPPPLLKNVKRMRQSIIAGRSQAFRKGMFNLENTNGLNSLDVKSLYPFVMSVCVYPMGQEIETTKFIPGKMGIYNVHIISQPKTKIIPRREKGKPLDWEYVGEFDAVLTTVDIDVLRDFDAEFEIIPFENSDTVGYYWQESGYIFKDYVEPLKEAKTQQDIWKDEGDKVNYNPALREMIKLYLNSLSGKVGQREYLKDISFCFTDNQMQTFLSTHSNVVYDELPKMGRTCIKLEGDNDNYEYKEKNAKPFHIAAFIYSWARSHMYRSILSKVDNKFFTDTDSCHLLEDEITNLKDEGHGFGKFHMGKEFGDYEKEIGFKVLRYYSIAPKCYAMFGVFPRVEKKFKYLYEELQKSGDKRSDMSFEEFFKTDSGETSKLRFKGINQRADKLFEIVEADEEEELRAKIVKAYKKKINNEFNGKVDKATNKKIGGKSIIEKFDMYTTLPVACDESLYQALTAGKCVALLSSQIKRVTGFKNVSSMYQNFMVKTITPSGKVHN